MMENMYTKSLNFDMSDLLNDLALDEILEEKKRRFRVKRHALPPMDHRKDYHK